MFNPVLVLETALLMLAAFLVGATIGALARLALRRKPTATGPTVIVETVATMPAEPAAALVTAPRIEPLPTPVAPVVPSEIPTPDFATAIQAEPVVAVASKPVAIPADERPSMRPARTAGQTTAGKLVPSPLKSPAEAALPAGTAASADVIPFPVDRSSSAQAAHEPALEPAPEAQTEEPTPESEIPAVETVTEAPAALPDRELVAEVVAVASPGEPEPALAAPEVEAPPVTETAKEPEHDEAAAMRAIEGNWSPRRTKRTRPTEAAESPAPAEPAAFGRPSGLEAPRGGRKDQLTHIIGVVPIIETALNRIGVFHFDQLAAFSDDNVAWLEGHLGIAGRIDREHWREQARELAVLSEKAAKAASKA
jgi:predicted flap endonuclease-1-like 5' DNA nuclease